MRDFVLYRSLVLGTATLFAGIGCSGCVALTKPGANSSCSWSHPASSDDTSGAASNTVVLIDTSASYWPRKGGSASLPDSPRRHAECCTTSATPAGRLVSLGTFNGSSTTITWQLADTALPTPTGTAGSIQKEKQAAGKCLAPLVTQARQGRRPFPGRT